MTIEGFVTRDLLALPDLELNDPVNGFRIVEPYPVLGVVTWRRRSVAGFYVHGETLIDAVKENPVVILTMAIAGATANQIDSRVATLRAAFEQRKYNLHLEIDGADHEYICEMADHFSGAQGAVDLMALRGGWQVHTFRIPRNPTPVQGSH